MKNSTLDKGINGVRLLAVVATQSIAVLAALLAARIEQPYRLDLNFLALSMWLWGGMLYIWMMSLIFYRYTFFSFSPGDLSPPYWINMGAMAISTLVTGSILIGNAQEAWFLHSILPFIKGFTIFYWATGTWWILMLVIWDYGGMSTSVFHCAMTRFIGGRSFHWACMPSPPAGWTRPWAFIFWVACRLHSRSRSGPGVWHLGLSVGSAPGDCPEMAVRQLPAIHHDPPALAGRAPSAVPLCRPQCTVCAGGLAFSRAVWSLPIRCSGIWAEPDAWHGWRRLADIC
ncbi:MAG: tellurite resistance/C4-dicarboxylate transporter family protein [Paracoccaceae bacterium]